MDNKNVQILQSYLASLTNPRSEEKPSQWVHNHLKLTKDTARHGNVDMEHIPYAQEIIDDTIENAETEQVTLMFPSRMAKTLTVFSIFCYYQINIPRPAIIVLPSQQSAGRLCKQKLHPLIYDSEVFDDEIIHTRKINTEEITLRRSQTWIVGAGSIVNIAAISASLCYIDEIDKIHMPENSYETSDVLELVRQRASEYNNSKIIISSTPTITDAQIWRQYRSSSRGRFYIPCPKCKNFIVFDNLSKVGKHECSLDWEYIDKERGQIDEKSVHITCHYCMNEIYDHERKALLNKGKWIHEEPDNKNKGYHLNKLHSLDTSLYEIACAQREAKKSNIPKLHNFYNAYKGLPFDRNRIETNETYEHIASKRRKISDLLDDTKSIIIGIDVQKGYFVYSVINIQRETNRWAVLELDAVNTWDDVKKLWNRTFFGKKADGMIIDGKEGSRQEEIQKKVEELGQGVYVYMGYAMRNKRYDFNKKNKQIVMGNSKLYAQDLCFKLYNFSTKDDEEGCIYFSSSIRDKFLKQVAAIKSEEKEHKIEVSFELHKLDTQDHAFDSMKMALCLDEFLKVPEKITKKKKVNKNKRLLNKF